MWVVVAGPVLICKTLVSPMRGCWRAVSRGVVGCSVYQWFRLVMSHNRRLFSGRLAAGGGLATLGRRTECWRVAGVLG